MLARASRVFFATSIGLAAAIALVAPAASAAPETKAPAGPPVPAEARRLEAAFASAADRVSPSVVQVDVATRDEDEARFTRWLAAAQQSDSPLAHGAGSGVVLTADGSILTNNHLIADALSIHVRLSDGRVLPAKLVGRDPGTDLAVLKVEAQGLVPAKFSESDTTRAGQWVVAVGSPFGTGTTISSGVLSAKGRNTLGYAVEDYLQTDAAITASNSGGPVCDLEGRVLGIASDLVGRSSGIGFAIPSSVAKRVAEQLVKTGRVVRPWIGATLQELTADLAALMKLDPRAGVIITSVAEGGPAKKANLKAGDVIASVAGKPVRDPAELQREVLGRDVNQAIAFEVLRDGQRYSTQITLTARPEPALAPVPVQQQGVPQVGLGFNVRDLTTQEATQRGLAAKAMPVITVVAPGSSADRAGVKVGDEVVEADGVVEPSTQQLQQAAQDGQVLLRLRRRDMAFYAAVRK